jgi:hypothetical protein
MKYKTENQENLEKQSEKEGIFKAKKSQKKRRESTVTLSDRWCLYERMEGGELYGHPERRGRVVFPRPQAERSRGAGRIAGAPLSLKRH